MVAELDVLYAPRVGWMRLFNTWLFSSRQKWKRILTLIEHVPVMLDDTGIPRSAQILDNIHFSYDEVLHLLLTPYASRLS